MFMYILTLPEIKTNINDKIFMKCKNGMGSLRMGRLHCNNAEMGGERYFDVPAGKWDCPGIVKGVVVCCMAYCCSLDN